MGGTKVISALEKRVSFEKPQFKVCTYLGTYAAQPVHSNYLIDNGMNNK